MKPYEFIEHTADIVIRAYGNSLEEAFAVAARAMFDVITAEAKIGHEQDVEFEIDALDLEGLLVGFLSRLIVIHEVDHLVLGRFEVSFDSARHLKARAWGEKFNEARHGGGTNVKAVSYHMLEIAQEDEETQTYVQVLFDV